MPTLVMVYNTSRVFWGPVIRFRSSCKIDITFFPFDTQICKLKLGSWAYTGLEVSVCGSPCIILLMLEQCCIIKVLYT